MFFLSSHQPYPLKKKNKNIKKKNKTLKTKLKKKLKMTTKKNVMILCSIVFIAYVLYKYYCSNINSQENEANLITCSNLNELSFGDQLFRVSSIIGLAKKHDKQAIFPHWNLKNVFDVRISKHFVNEVPHIAETSFSKKKSCDLIHLKNSTDFFENNVSTIRSLFTFNYEYSLMVISQLPCLMENCCVGVYFDKKDSKYANEDFYIAALDFLLEKFPTITIVFFCDDWRWFNATFENLQKYKLTNNVYISPFCYIDDSNFIAFSLCSFKVLSNVENSFQWWAAWLNNRFNSITIAPLPEYNGFNVEQYSNFLLYDANRSDFLGVSLLECHEKVGGIIFYNHQTFNLLCEAFRRVYPTSALKVLIQPEQLHIIADIEFFHGEILPAYTDISGFLELTKTFIEPFFVFLIDASQFDYPINTIGTTKHLFNTGEMQLATINDFNQNLDLNIFISKK